MPLSAPTARTDHDIIHAGGAWKIRHAQCSLTVENVVWTYSTLKTTSTSVLWGTAPYRDLDLIDATGESWVPLLDKMILAPGFMARWWRKVDIIRLFNESRSAKESGLQYPESLIPSRRLDAIVNDLVALLLRSRGSVRPKSEKIG
jgi:hypothetical protein